MPVVRVNDATFADLKSLATWLNTSTPSDTIDRAVQMAMGSLGMVRDTGQDAALGDDESELMLFDATPGLAFTKPITASVNGKQIPRPTWVGILLSVIKEAKKHTSHPIQLAREMNIPAKAEKYEKDGYKYYPDLGISVQGQSAHDAWREIERLATRWHIAVNVEFIWRQNPKAQHPGKRGALSVGRT